MKRFCFVAVVLIGLCQWNNAFGQGQEDMENFLREMQSPRWLLFQEAQDRPGYRTLWNGQGDASVTRIILGSGGERSDDSWSWGQSTEQAHFFLPTQYTDRLTHINIYQSMVQLIQPSI